MDFTLDETDAKKYLHHIRLSYESTGEFYKKLRMVFIEIPKFTKTEKELKTGVEKWLFVLKNMSRLKKIPVILNSRIFTKLFDMATVSNLTREEYRKYQDDMMAKWDEYAIKKTLIKEGIEKGRKEEKKLLITNLLKRNCNCDASLR